MGCFLHPASSFFKKLFLLFYTILYIIIYYGDGGTSGNRGWSNSAPSASSSPSNSGEVRQFLFACLASSPTYRRENARRLEVLPPLPCTVSMWNATTSPGDRSHPSISWGPPAPAPPSLPLPPRSPLPEAEPSLVVVKEVPGKGRSGGISLREPGANQRAWSPRNVWGGVGMGIGVVVLVCQKGLCWVGAGISEGKSGYSY